MKLVCLGGAGAMASSALYDLHRTSDFHSIVIAKELGFAPRDILSTEIIGSKGGIGERVVYHCIPPFPFFEGKPMTASMEYGSFVGVTCSIVLQMLARGEIKEKEAFIVQTTDNSTARLLGEYEKRGFSTRKERTFQG
jgi:saccharopine dehydrogenase-like NADP-dependent oxidoreductase